MSGRHPSPAQMRALKAMADGDSVTWNNTGWRTRRVLYDLDLVTLNEFFRVTITSRGEDALARPADRQVQS